MNTKIIDLVLELIFRFWWVGSFMKVMGHDHLLEIRLLETSFLILFQPNP